MTNDEKPIPNSGEPSADRDLPTTMPTPPSCNLSHSDSYEDDDVEGSPNSSHKPADIALLFSPNATAPAAAGHRHKKSALQHCRLQPRDEESMLEDDSSGRREMILKPRELIHPETPKDGLRRSKRTRIAPMRRWLGETAVYQYSPSGGQQLVGANKVVITDPIYVKAGTTNPIKALELRRKK